MYIDEIVSKIEPLSERAMAECEQRWDKIAKPLKSLGRLESVIAQIAGIQRTKNVDISKPVVCVMCADNGVVAQGVTQVGSEVTGAVAENMTRGESSVCVMAKYIGADVVPVDIGIDHEMNIDGLVNRKIMLGTNDISKMPAMSLKQVSDAINVGVEMAEKLKNDGYNIIITGEMGIGNTTTSSAVASVLLGKPVEEMTGRGAGLSDSGLIRKINAIKEAIEINKPDPKDPIDVLAKVGGLDIAGMVGLYLGGAVYRMPVVIDGFISAAAALAARKIAPLCHGYMIPSHVSSEPAARLILKELEAEPLIDCGMCLGEGTGGVAGVNLLNIAMAVYNSMSEFEEVDIEQYVPQV